MNGRTNVLNKRPIFLTKEISTVMTIPCGVLRTTEIQIYGTCGWLVACQEVGKPMRRTNAVTVVLQFSTGLYDTFEIISAKLDDYWMTQG